MGLVMVWARGGVEAYLGVVLDTACDDWVDGELSLLL